MAESKMNIIELAKEAGVAKHPCFEKPDVYPKLERFAALVRAPLQAKIDRLMLKYCPDEMTDEQLAEWGKHQSPADMHWVDLTDDEIAELKTKALHQPMSLSDFARAVIAAFKEKNK